jgi:hypothetical protein
MRAGEVCRERGWASAIKSRARHRAARSTPWVRALCPTHSSEARASSATEIIVRGGGREARRWRSSCAPRFPAPDTYRCGGSSPSGSALCGSSTWPCSVRVRDFFRTAHPAFLGAPRTRQSCQGPRAARCGVVGGGEVRLPKHNTKQGMSRARRDGGRRVVLVVLVGGWLFLSDGGRTWRWIVFQS